MKRILLILSFFVILGKAANSQSTFGNEYHHSMATYPSFFNIEGKKTYSVTIDAENGAEAYWEMNINGLVKNYCALDGLSLTTDNPAFKVEIKLFRKTDSATPLEYKILDDKGKVLFMVFRDDKRFNVLPGGDYRYHMQTVLKMMNADLRSAIDFGIVKIKLSSLNLSKNNAEFSDYVDVQNGVNSSLGYSTHYPGKFFIMSPVTAAEAFWKTKFYNTQNGDKKVRNIKLLTAYNLATIYAFNGDIDSAGKWLLLAKTEENRNSYVEELESFLNFQTQNIANFKVIPQSLRDNRYDPSIKTANMVAATSRSVSARQDVYEIPSNAIPGYIVKKGKRTEGAFLPLANNKIDLAFVKFIPKKETAAKSISIFSADSLVISNDRYLPVANKFGKIVFENTKIRVIQYIPANPSANDCCPYYYLLLKATNQNDSYVPGLGRLSKFITKYFANCPTVVAQQEAGVYDKLSVTDAILKAAQDFSEKCN